MTIIFHSLNKSRRDNWKFTHKQHHITSKTNGDVYFHTSTDGRWNLINASFIVDDKEAGYIRILGLDQKRARETFKTPWHFLRHVRGCCFDPDNLRNTWEYAHLHAHTSPASNVNISFTALCNIEAVSNETMLNDLNHLDKVMGYTKDMRKYLKQWNGFHIIEYISVEKVFRRQGIGSGLYVEMAKYLGQLGFPLYSSTLISDSAIATWRSMMVSGRYPMRISRRFCSKGQSRWVLDFRNKP